MSRVGKTPISLPDKVKVSVAGNVIKVEGPKGKLSCSIDSTMKVDVDGSIVTVTRPNETRNAKSMHGLSRALIANMVEGVATGFSKKLDVQGVGYRCEVKGKQVHLALGFSHPVVYDLPQGVDAKVEEKTKLVLTGIDKQVIGATAAKIRSFRPPEPYGGKGIRYADEYVRRKEGKSGAK